VRRHSVASPNLDSSSASGEDQFDWWRQWYPVALERDLDPALPTKVGGLPRRRPVSVDAERPRLADVSR
jgi:hypothetical protein